MSSQHSLEEGLGKAVSGSVVMITGASSGIGAAAARRMGKAGATALLVGRSEDRLRAVEREITESGGTARRLPTDLRDYEATETLVDVVRGEYGSVDVLVSNAGKSIRRSIEHSYDRLHDFQRTSEVNYIGPVNLVLGLLPGMRDRQRGHIINVSSLAVLFPAPRFAAYSASKSAFDVFLRCLAPEVRRDGVAVTNIYLPLVRTPMSEPIERWGSLPGLTPDEAAARICRAVVKRPLAMAPALARAGRAAMDLFPAGYETLLEWAYQSSDRGAGLDERQVEAPRAQVAFEAWSRMTSWTRSRRR